MIYNGVHTETILIIILWKLIYPIFILVHVNPNKILKIRTKFVQNLLKIRKKYNYFWLLNYQPNPIFLVIKPNHDLNLHPIGDDAICERPQIMIIDSMPNGHSIFQLSHSQKGGRIPLSDLSHYLMLVIRWLLYGPYGSIRFVICSYNDYYSCEKILFLMLYINILHT